MPAEDPFADAAVPAGGDPAQEAVSEPEQVLPEAVFEPEPILPEPVRQRVITWPPRR